MKIVSDPLILPLLEILFPQETDIQYHYSISISLLTTNFYLFKEFFSRGV